MRTFILLSFVAMITGCQHAPKCTPACRSMSPRPTCKVRNSGSCCDQTAVRPPCDLSNACRSVQSRCQKVCQTPSNLTCKKPALGWKEVRIPVLKLKDRQVHCASNSCCRTPATGCCQELPTPDSEATPFLTVPPESAVPQPQTQQLQSNQLPQPQQPIASSATTDLARRTQALESQVNQIHSVLLQRQAPNLSGSGYIDPRNVPSQPNDVIMLPPPPAWRTMDGVPPIPNSPIEQTGAYRSNPGTYRTADNPQMWPHSPQNMQRSMLR
ncbi:MAG: hypothetical protein HQ518_24860 [Rhodopirellula sp.]|nr:hypothetical protein [Rhodopirellula sp.]